MRKRKMMMSDAINSLPESLLLHILSFLEMKEVMRASLVSRNWRYLWLSLPTLTFDYASWQSIHGLMDSIHRALLLGDSNIHKLSISLNYTPYECRRLKDCINMAIARHVKDISLRIYSSRRLQLPPFLFTSPIKAFDLCSERFRPVLLPNSLCSAACLKTLRLGYAKFPKGNSKKELIMACPVLENLVINDCQYGHLKVINISAPLLKTLVISNDYHGPRKCSCKITVCTPNLKSIESSGYIYGDIVLENLSSLVSVKMALHVPPIAKCLRVFLKGLDNATTLELATWKFKNSSSFRAILNQLSATFRNLRCIELGRWCDNSWISVIANLLRSSPFIETLLLREIEAYCDSSKEEEDPGKDLSSESMFYHLKFVKVQVHNSKGSANELKFLEFLLRNSTILENIAITATKQLSGDKERKLAEFGKKLHSLPRASSTVKVYFLVKN